MRINIHIKVQKYTNFDINNFLALICYFWCGQIHINEKDGRAKPLLSRVAD